ncbi:MAG: TolB family protein [Thermomicrobiales bacterium]
MKRQTRLATAFAMITACLLFASGGAAQQATPDTLSPQHYVAGERSRLLELSPSGELVAGINDDEELCSFEVPSGDEIACVDVRQQKISVDFESISWAPDSSAFVFSVPAFAYFTDGDLWMFDANTGDLNNLTDDGIEGKLPLTGDLAAGEVMNVDVAPVWSPDGASIAFSRSIITAETGLDAPNELWVLDVASGDAKRVATVDENSIGVLYYGLLWSPDGQMLYATYNFYSDVDPDHDASGVHAIDLATGEDTLITGRSSDFRDDVPTVMSISPDGKTLVVCFADYVLSAQRSGTGGYALLSTADGSLTPVDPPADIDPDQAFAITPAFSADGNTLVYAVVRFTTPGGLVMARDLETGEETIIATLPDGALPVAIARNQSLIIGANGTALLPVSPFEAYLVQISDSAPRQGHIEISLLTPEPVG